MDGTPPTPPISPTPDLRASVERTLDKMPWLGATDEAMRALALRLADEIEGAVARAREYEILVEEAGDDPAFHSRLTRLERQCNATKMVGWLGPQLRAILADLGGNPGARKDLGETSKSSKRLEELRGAAKGAGRKYDA